MSKERILVVEDERIVAEEIRQILQSMGYVVTGIVSKGPDAIKAAGENPPDLILMDIRLKGEMDGITAAGIIMERYMIPVIYLTAYSDDETLQRAKLTRPLGYILKPLDTSHVRSVIEIAFYRYKREKLLFESEQWLSATLKSIENGIIATNGAGEIVFMNPAACMLTGVSLAKATGKHIDEVVSIVDINSNEKKADFFRGVIAGMPSRSSKGTAILRSGDGYEIPVKYVVAPIKDESGQRPGFMMIFHDISKRLKIEKMLLSDEISHQSFAEAAGEGVVSVDTKHNIMFINKKMADMLGYSRDVLLGQPIFNYVSQNCVPSLHSKLWSSGKSTVTKSDMELLKSDGSTVWAVLTINTMVDKCCDYSGALIIASDVTERKTVESMLVKARENTELYLDLMEKEFGGASSIVMGQLEAARDMLDKGKPVPDCKQILDKAMEVQRSSSRLIEDVRKLRLENEGQIPREILDLGKELSAIKERYAKEQPRVTIEYAPVEGCKVIASRLITNLFSCIMDSMIVYAPGPVKLGIAMEKVQQDGREHYAIAISGPPAIVKGQPDGADIASRYGFYRAKVIAASYGGDIRIEETPGVGTKCVVLLPTL